MSDAIKSIIGWTIVLVMTTIIIIGIIIITSGKA